MPFIGKDRYHPSSAGKDIQQEIITSINLTFTASEVYYSYDIGETTKA
jgi:hypothetical protein